MTDTKTPRETLLMLWAANEAETDALNEIVDAIEEDVRAEVAAKVSALPSVVVTSLYAAPYVERHAIDRAHVLAILEETS